MGDKDGEWNKGKIIKVILIIVASLLAVSGLSYGIYTHYHVAPDHKNDKTEHTKIEKNNIDNNLYNVHKEDTKENNNRNLSQLDVNKQKNQPEYQKASINKVETKNNQTKNNIITEFNKNDFIINQ